MKDGREVWGTSASAIWTTISTAGSDIKALQLSGVDDGTREDLGDGIEATRLVSDLQIIPGLWKIDGYSGLMRSLETSPLGLRSGENLFPFPYDWRRDNRASARRLEKAATSWLHAWRTRSGNGDAKIVFVVHSMGGLVASYYVEALEGWRDTRALISFGTPFRGSLNALGYLANGYSKGIGPFKVDLTETLASFPSVYQLLPAFECIDSGGGTLGRVGEMAGLPGVDAGRAAEALAFYREIESRRKANELIDAYKREPYTSFPIVGVAQPTFQSATVSNGCITLLQTFKGKDDSGDGTVPRVSATPLGLSGEKREIYVAQVHASLQNFEPALVNVLSILAGTQIDLGSFRFAQNTLSVDVDDVYPASSVVLRARPSDDGTGVTARIVAAGTDAGDDVVLGGGDPDGWLSATLALPPGPYRAIFSAPLPGAPATVTDVFMVVDDASRTGRLKTEAATVVPIAQLGEEASRGRHLPAATPEALGPPTDDRLPVTLRITLVQGGLTNVQTPIAIVPRYDGLALAGTARAFDRLLDSWLSRAIDLGIVGSGLGQLFPMRLERLYKTGVIKTENLLLASMGEPTGFAQDSLQYLVSNIVVAVKSGGYDRFACPLIGIRRRELLVAEAVRALVLGVLDGYERLKVIAAALTSDRRNFIGRMKRAVDVVLVEPDPDRLDEITRALGDLASEGINGLALEVKLGGKVAQDKSTEPGAPDTEPEIPATLIRVTRSKTSSPRFVDGKVVPRSFRDSNDTYQFSALSDIAAVPVREVDINGYWLKSLPESLIQSRDDAQREQLGRFLSNIILPEDFRKLVETSKHLIFEVDDAAAHIPWEMAAFKAFSKTTFLGTRESGGISRQLRTMLSPPPTSSPPLNKSLKVLVIADPAGGTLSLPGAMAEGVVVVKVLCEAQRAWKDRISIEVTVRIGASGDAQAGRHIDELRGLPSVVSADFCAPLETAMLIIEEQFDLIHYAGHGFCDPQSGRAGWVLSADCLLTAQEIFRVRQVPRLVFANACFSAVTVDGEGTSIDGIQLPDQEVYRRSVALAQAFFGRGIPNYVGTGWKVDDAAACECARWFYARALGLVRPDADGGLTEGAPPATIGDALSVARSKTAAIMPHSSTWGAYQHYGRVGDKLLAIENTAPAQDDLPGVLAEPSRLDATPAGEQPAPPPADQVEPIGVTVLPPRMPVASKPIGATPTDMVYVNGIDLETGQYAAPPRPVSEVVRSVLLRPGLDRFVDFHIESPRSFGIQFGVDASKLEEAGWGVVFAEGTPDAVKTALRPLLDLRKRQAAERYKECELKSGQQTRDWLASQNVSPGSVDPELVPLYLLLVGPPDAIPFEFQYLLGVEYAVGRLAFDTADEYARYAASTVRYETDGTVPNAREIRFWGTQHPGDPATALSASMLVTPLASGLPDADGALRRPLGTEAGFATRLHLADGATKANLLDALHAKVAPAMVFTASHGMAASPGKPNQTQSQGALLCQDWTGFGSVRPEHFLAASDVGDDANVRGLVAMSFACFSAGTPRRDQFPMDLALAGKTPDLAPNPFIAALPQRLLTHPKGSALAVIGHVDRAWGFSIQAANMRGAQIGMFRSGIGLILKGTRIGLALSGNFSARYAALSTALASATAPAAPVLSDRELVNLWLERNDAQNYVLLGDPAVRIRTEDLQQV